jgi:urease accessory protein UreF
MTDVTAESVTDVESFARFLGQQLALLLNRLDLIRERDMRRAQAKRMSERLEARKNLHRASGLVAKTRGISNQQALRLLVSHARKSRRSLNCMAETVLLGYEAPLTRRPMLRRLHADEFTRPRPVAASSHGGGR